MSFVARYLILIAAVFLAVNPVMACCITGHSPDAVAAESIAPPCHGNQTDEITHTTENTEDAACLGCGDCDSVIVQAPSLTDMAALGLTKNIDGLSGSSQIQFGLEAPRLLRATGPPRSFLLRTDTPLSLKQLLLI